MVGYTDRKRYMKDKYNCDLMMIEGVELVPLYQIIDRLEKSVSPDSIKQAREEISEMRKEHNVSVTDCLDVLDKLIAEVDWE